MGGYLRGDASIAPYIPFIDGTVGRGLDPYYAVFRLLRTENTIVGGVEDAAPYTLARPYPLAEESAAGSRQSNIC